MRIIAGKHRGRKLLELKEDGVRPTLDRVRESLFNILSQKVIDSSFLDLFTGSGAVGIEALSRGAKKVTFVDKNPKIIAHVKKNLSLINETGECFVSDYKTALKKLGGSYDVIYLDPPYAFDSYEVTNAIENSGILSDDGLVIYEHDSASKILVSDAWEIYDERKYGIATLSFLRRKNV